MTYRSSLYLLSALLLGGAVHGSDQKPRTLKDRCVALFKRLPDPVQETPTVETLSTYRSSALGLEDSQWVVNEQSETRFVRERNHFPVGDGWKADLGLGYDLIVGPLLVDQQGEPLRVSALDAFELCLNMNPVELRGEIRDTLLSGRIPERGIYLPTIREIEAFHSATKGSDSPLKLPLFNSSHKEARSNYWASPAPYGLSGHKLPLDAAQFNAQLDVVIIGGKMDRQTSRCLVFCVGR